MNDFWQALVIWPGVIMLCLAVFDFAAGMMGSPIDRYDDDV